MSAFTLSNIYSNVLTSYAPKSTRYDSHKRDELKSVYKSIVKQNEDAPLFLMDESGESQRFAVNLKEDARELKNTISSLSSDYSSSILDKKIASSNNEDLVEAKYIGPDQTIDDAPSFDISVDELASNQVNIGTFLPNNEMSLEPGNYSFDINVNDTDYEFQFSIEAGDTNADIEGRIARLISHANIGLSASVIPGDDTSALRIESTSTGVRGSNGMNFVVSDENTSRRKGAVDYFGINNVSHYPSNASFTINGKEHTAFSNNFTVDKSFELLLKGTTEEGSSVHIGLKTDLDALTENINNLAGAYNDFIRKAAEYTNNYGRSGKFMYEMSTLAGSYANALDAVGLALQEDGTLAVDSKLLMSSASEDDPKESLSAIQKFTNALTRKSNEISLNPMKYADQVVVAYKNPGKNFPNPYVTSMYSGMLFSSYC
ncbi:MAG: flagellar filament capping protein FliD [Lachnospiraceae bacterium]|nr:flagellar filament capping protein FliD [Lachnospiraceae bacterium]